MYRFIPGAVDNNIRSRNYVIPGRKAYEFSYEELVSATNDFADETEIGNWKECVAIFEDKEDFVSKTRKALVVRRLKARDCVINFVAGVHELSGRYHPHIQNVVGYCVHGNDNFLICDWKPHTLDNLLHGPDLKLDWKARIHIALQVAKAIEFLHEDNRPPILFGPLHLNMVLVGADHHVKLRDYLFIETLFLWPLYNAPRSKEGDVYNFGGLLLELICGEKVCQPGHEYPHLFPIEEYLLHHQVHLEIDIDILKSLGRFRDPKLDGNDSKFTETLNLALSCRKKIPAERPSIREAVIELKQTLSELAKCVPQTCFDFPQVLIGSSVFCPFGVSLSWNQLFFTVQQRNFDIFIKSGLACFACTNFLSSFNAIDRIMC